MVEGQEARRGEETNSGGKEEMERKARGRAASQGPGQIPELPSPGSSFL